MFDEDPLDEEDHLDEDGNHADDEEANDEFLEEYHGEDKPWGEVIGATGRRRDLLVLMLDGISPCIIKRAQRSR
jgi:hypothetical protein